MIRRLTTWFYGRCCGRRFFFLAAQSERECRDKGGEYSSLQIRVSSPRAGSESFDSECRRRRIGELLSSVIMSLHRPAYAGHGDREGGSRRTNLEKSENRTVTAYSAVARSTCRATRSIPSRCNSRSTGLQSRSAFSRLIHERQLVSASPSKVRSRPTIRTRAPARSASPE